MPIQKSSLPKNATQKVYKRNKKGKQPPIESA